MADGRREVGAGDRWLAGERVDGVLFGHHDRVEFVTGRFGGERGRVELLLALGPEPRYLVALERGGEAVRVRQSALRAAR